MGQFYKSGGAYGKDGDQDQRNGIMVPLTDSILYSGKRCDHNIKVP